MKMQLKTVAPEPTTGIQDIPKTAFILELTVYPALCYLLNYCQIICLLHKSYLKITEL